MVLRTSLLTEEIGLRDEREAVELRGRRPSANRHLYYYRAQAHTAASARPSVLLTRPL
jgi:hypothetical protein